MAHQHPIFPELALATAGLAGFTEAYILDPGGTGNAEADRTRVGGLRVGGETLSQRPGVRGSIDVTNDHGEAVRALQVARRQVIRQASGDRLDDAP